jgi:hypothetical protein
LKKINLVIDNVAPVEGEIIPDNPEIDGATICDSDRRVLEISCKGIFACPRYTEFFHNKDDTRLE